MAISILQQPSQHVPAYNDIIYVASSTNYAQTNFNYLATIYIGSDTVTLKAAPDPTYGSGVFNFGRIVESYVNSDISTTAYGFQLNTNSFKSFYVKFGEEYGVSSGVTQYPNLYTSETRYAWNGIVDFRRFQSYADTGYLFDNSQRTFNSSGVQYIESNQDAWQYVMAKDLTQINYAMIRTYDSTNTLLQICTIQNPFQTSGTISHHYVRFGCGTRNLNLAGATSGISAGTQPIITSSVSYYTVGFITSSVPLNPVETYRYNIVAADCRYTTYRLHYLNELGAFDSINFNKKTVESTDIKREKYKSPYGSLTSSSAYGYNKSDRGDRAFYIELKDGLKLSTDWLTDATYAQLEQLITSPEIYLQDATDGLISVSITDSKYEKKTALNDKLIRLEINLEYGYNRYRQRD